MLVNFKLLFWGSILLKVRSQSVHFHQKSWFGDETFDAQFFNRTCFCRTLSRSWPVRFGWSTVDRAASRQHQGGSGRWGRKSAWRVSQCFHWNHWQAQSIMLFQSLALLGGQQLKHSGNEYSLWSKGCGFESHRVLFRSQNLSTAAWTSRYVKSL